MSTISINHVRRRLERADYRLWQVRGDSRDFWEYGPLSIIDARSTAVVARGLTLDDATRFVPLR